MHRTSAEDGDRTNGYGNITRGCLKYVLFFRPTIKVEIFRLLSLSSLLVMYAKLEYIEKYNKKSELNRQWPRQPHWWRYEKMKNNENNIKNETLKMCVLCNVYDVKIIDEIGQRYWNRLNLLWQTRRHRINGTKNSCCFLCLLFEFSPFCRFLYIFISMFCDSICILFNLMHTYYNWRLTRATKQVSAIKIHWIAWNFSWLEKIIDHISTFNREKKIQLNVVFSKYESKCRHEYFDLKR